MDELQRFMSTYEAASNSHDFDQVAPLITDDAVYWFNDGSFSGKEAIRRAFEKTWASIEDETYTISDVRWLGVTNSLAVCIYAFTAEGVVDGVWQAYRGRGTNVLTNEIGHWRVSHEHLSSAR